MNVIATVAEMQDARAVSTGVLGLVPTMGFLHEGHLSLVRRARADNDHVVVSIFVNPAQFNESADFRRYPRDTERDLQLLQAEGVDIVFIPSVDEMYPPGFDDWVELPGPLTERLEGAARPGHFRGVTTVVARLFRIIRPHRVYFGQKDAQQLRVIRRMTRELSARPACPPWRETLEGPVEIVAMPIVRDPDGLAMSSRNVHLSPPERAAALALPRALAIAREMVARGVTDAAMICRAVREIVAPRVEPPRRGVSTVALHLEYVSVSDEETFEELDAIDRPAIVLLAARAGGTRLIDNTIVVPPGIAVPRALSPLMKNIASRSP